jgi:hypothetical protein
MTSPDRLQKLNTNFHQRAMRDFPVLQSIDLSTIRIKRPLGSGKAYDLSLTARWHRGELYLMEFT